MIQSHRSIRRFLDKEIKNDILNEILTSAQWAPSSHNGQTYSIIVVQDQAVKEELSKVCKSQKWVVDCPVFLVFCIDFYRLQTNAQIHNATFEAEGVQSLLVGTVDTSLAAQNALLAARSYGLSGVMIGGIRENPKRVIELLNLPQLTFPLFGMCLGYPDGTQWQKPRLPSELVVHQETYQTESLSSGLEKYEKATADYYTKRTKGKKTVGWSTQMADYYSRAHIPKLKAILLEQGFKMK